MNQLSFPILSTLLYVPLLGAIILLFVNRKYELFIKSFTLVFSIVEFAISLPLFFYFNEQAKGMQFVEKAAWFPEWGMSYFLGIDGISLLLVLLTTFLMILCVLISWKAIENRVKEYFIAFLFLETACIGTLCALDLVLFYVFWELMLIPMYLLIGIWGGARRIYAAIKFFLFTMAGSVLMLLAILALYFYFGKTTGTYTFNVLDLYNGTVPVGLQYWLFAAFALSFAIKVPMFPVHTWLPDAHTEAPTAGSVILAGVLLKMGTYGFLRFAIPLFPKAALDAVPLISILAIIGIIYGAIVSMMQPDVKRLVAFSSVSHMGYVMLGMFALNMQGLQGSIYQMLNHGVSTGGLFLLIGMIYERRHTRMISEFGGLSATMPIFAVFFMIVTLSSIALPGTNGFVGEFLILFGAFKAHMWYGIIATTGVVLGAVYMLWTYQRVMFGEIKNEANRKVKDIGAREIFILCTVSFLIILMGVYPKMFFRKMDTSVQDFLSFVNQKNAYYLSLDGKSPKAPNANVQTPGRQSVEDAQ